MNLALARINKLIAGSNPDHYDSVSYNKYFRELADISNKILEDEERNKQKIAKLAKAINELESNDEKVKLLDILLS